MNSFSEVINKLKNLNRKFSVDANRFYIYHIDGSITTAAWLQGTYRYIVNYSEIPGPEIYSHDQMIGYIESCD